MTNKEQRENMRHAVRSELTNLIWIGSIVFLIFTAPFIGIPLALFMWWVVKSK